MPERHDCYSGLPGCCPTWHKLPENHDYYSGLPGCCPTWHKLPEYNSYLERAPMLVDALTQKECSYIAETLTLADLVDGLNALGVSPREMIDILKSIKSAGALHAELVVQ